MKISTSALFLLVAGMFVFQVSTVSAAAIVTLDGSQGWVNYGTTSEGQASIGSIGGQEALLLEVHSVPPAGGDKAGIRYYDAANPLGKLSDLTSYTFDWYRDGASETANPLQAPALRLYVRNSANQIVQLVWELSYDANTVGSAPEDEWITQDVFEPGNRIWARTTTNHDSIALMHEIDGWVGVTINGRTIDANSQIIGIEASIGTYVSGDLLVGVDNITLGFNNGQSVHLVQFGNDPVTAPVPEPTTAALGLFGAGALALSARRRRV